MTLTLGLTLIAASFVVGLLTGIGILSRGPRKHTHVWAKWEKYHTVEVYNSLRLPEEQRAFRGHKYYFKRECETCGIEETRVEDTTDY